MIHCATEEQRTLWTDISKKKLDVVDELPGIFRSQAYRIRALAQSPTRLVWVTPESPSHSAHCI
jgi:hypothetical protein